MTNLMFAMRQSAERLVFSLSESQGVSNTKRRTIVLHGTNVLTPPQDQNEIVFLSSQNGICQKRTRMKIRMGLQSFGRKVCPPLRYSDPRLPGGHQAPSKQALLYDHHDAEAGNKKISASFVVPMIRITASLLLWSVLCVTLAAAGLVPRQTLPPNHFFIQAYSTDPAVNGKFAFVYGSGGTIFIGPQINHQGWEPVIATFDAQAKTLPGGFGDTESIWVIRDQQGAISLTASSPSGASLNAPFAIRPGNEISSLWDIEYPYGWTTCLDTGSGNNVLFYQKFGPGCTPVKLLMSQGPVVN